MAGGEVPASEEMLNGKEKSGSLLKRFQDYDLSQEVVACEV